MIDLDELEKLEKAATPGPWKKQVGDKFGQFDLLIVAPENPNPNAIEIVVRNSTSIWYNDPDYLANFDFIAALRNAAPELIQRVRELEATLRNVIKFLKEDDALSGVVYDEIIVSLIRILEGEGK